MKKYTVPFLSLLLVVSLLILVEGFERFVESPTFSKDVVEAESAIIHDEIDAVSLAKELVSSEAPFLLDVRQPQEYQIDHIEGATLIPLGELSVRLNELPKDKVIVVYCRSGNRSARAAALLRENGFDKIENLIGGMRVWNATQPCDASKRAC
ncbi:MAG TPA: rhodanese-like domain-containing protein [Rhodospirillaceae bacterium]|nr:rhodanese-like domain-containing protein [Rhodospirillaceae bacterium]